jgi:hypothetical protein
MHTARRHFGFSFADVLAINGDEPVDAVNLALLFLAPTKDTFIEA